MANVGSNILSSHGLTRFYKLLAVCMAGSATLAAIDMHHNVNLTQAGGLGMTAGLITYAAFTQSRSLAMLRLQTITIVTTTLGYAFTYNDNAVIDSCAASYTAFLLALRSRLLKINHICYGVNLKFYKEFRFLIKTVVRVFT